jgi:hypothetical protein
MNRKIAVTSLLLLVSGIVRAGEPLTLSFEKDELGKMPAGWTSPLGKWVVEEAKEGGKVLAQTSPDAAKSEYPLCILDKPEVKDATVSIRMKPVEGKVDRAGGIIFRVKDKDNYYMVRANALEDNVRLYKIVKGERKQFAGESITVKARTWHTLKIEFKGKHFKVWFNDKLAFEADDDHFQEAGRVGLWTKADSVTQFDDVTITD